MLPYIPYIPPCKVFRLELISGGLLDWDPQRPHTIASRLIRVSHPWPGCGIPAQQNSGKGLKAVENNGSKGTLAAFVRMII